MAWTYPHEFHDGTGETASGVQVNDNFAKAKEKVEALEAQKANAATKYTEHTAFPMSTDVVLSATNWTHVVLRVATPNQAPTVEAQVLVGGKPVAQLFMVGEQAIRSYPISVMVAPGEAVRINPAGGWEATYSFRVLGTGI
jgi:hypothetical protein